MSVMDEKWYALSGGIISTTVGPDWADPKNMVATAIGDSKEDRAALMASAPDLLRSGYDLAMYVLQGGDYNDPDVKKAVDDIISIRKELMTSGKRSSRNGNN